MSRNASLARRFGAILYDSLLVVALMMLGTIPFVAVFGGEYVVAYPPHQLSMLLIAYGFFAGFWSWRGRTLGMQSWGMQLECDDGSKPGILRASVRFLASLLSWLPLGLGFWWQLWDRDRLAWHDRLSGTCLKHYPR